MAERIPAILVRTALRSRKNKAAVFDRAAADEDMPMCFAGLFGECGWDRQHGSAGFSEGTVERGETQVVAYGHADASPWDVGQHRQFAGPVVPRLAIALAALKVDVKHMNLVVAREDVALGIDEE